MNFDISYEPDADLLIVAEVGVMKVPIKISDVVLIGRMHLELQFTAASPLIDAVEVGFIHHPKLDFGIQVAKLVDVMDVSFFNNWLNKLVVDSLSNHVVLPASLKLSIKDMLQPEKAETSTTEASEATDLITLTKELADRFYHPEIDAMRVNALIRNTITDKRRRVQERLRVQKSKNKGKRRSGHIDNLQREESGPSLNLRKLMTKQKKEGKLHDTRPQFGTLQVRLIAGKDLKISGNFPLLPGTKPNPYVIFKVGNTYQKSKPSLQLKNPSWDQFFSFPLHEGDKMRVYVQVMSNRDFVGSEMVDFTEIETGRPVETWLHLHGMKEDTHNPRILLAITFLPSGH